MNKGSILLSSYNLEYEPRTAIRSQALADFVTYFCPGQEERVNKEVNMLTEQDRSGTWILFTDDASNSRGIKLGLVLKSPQGDKIVHPISCEFNATNNEIEYEALISGLELCLDLWARNVPAKVDPQLVANHINGTYTTKAAKMIGYLEFTKQITSRFKTFSIEQIPREQNTQADALASLGSKCQTSYP